MQGTDGCQEALQGEQMSLGFYSNPAEISFLVKPAGTLSQFKGKVLMQVNKDVWTLPIPD